MSEVALLVPSSGRQKLAERPYTWEELTEIVETGSDLSLLARSAEGERSYRAESRLLRSEWRSIGDYVLVDKFGFERQPVRLPVVAGTDADADEGGVGVGGVWEARPPLANSTTTRVVLCPNDFPYYLPPHVTHWVLWKINGSVTDADIERAEDDLKAGKVVWPLAGEANCCGGSSGGGCSPRAVTATMHWVNPPHLKSLAEIDHAHILCLSGDAATDIERG